MSDCTSWPKRRLLAEPPCNGILRDLTATDLKGDGPGGGRSAVITDISIRFPTNPRGITFLQNSYDLNSRVCQQVHPNSGTITYYYITADRVTLPESLQLLAEAKAGEPIFQTPCTGAAATALVDPRDKPTTYHFNGQSFLIQQTDSLVQVTTYEREDRTNLLLSVTDPLNRVTRYQYDGNGNVVQITRCGEPALCIHL